jgi:hypothetical protein
MANGLRVLQVSFPAPRFLIFFHEHFLSWSWFSSVFDGRHRFVTVLLSSRKMLSASSEMLSVCLVFLAATASADIGCLLVPLGSDDGVLDKVFGVDLRRAIVATERIRNGCFERTIAMESA